MRHKEFDDASLLSFDVSMRHMNTHVLLVFYSGIVVEKVIPHTHVLGPEIDAAYIANHFREQCFAISASLPHAFD